MEGHFLKEGYKKIPKKVAKKNLKMAILRAKEEAWKHLVATLDENIWRKPYKKFSRVLKKNRRTPKLSMAETRRLVKNLFR